MVVVIDIGSAETKVLLADPFSSRIAGVACGKTEGMEKGEIVDLKKLNSSVHKVIRAAEENSGNGEFRGRYACLTISSVAVSGAQIKGCTSVKNDSRRVSREDMETAREDACSNSLPAGSVLVHRLKQGYVLDNEACANPEDKISKTGQLLYNMWRICAGRSYLEELVQIPNNFSLEVKWLYCASLAADEALSDVAAGNKNRLVIDIGAGTTDYALFQDGVLSCTGVIPVGGGHITNDIAWAFQTNTKIAEGLKISHASARVGGNDHNKTISLLDNDGNYSQFIINFVVNQRVSELFELVKKELPAQAKLEIVKLTGGTSKLREIGDVAAEIFGARVKIDAPHFVFSSAPENFAGVCEDPKYSAMIGAYLWLVKSFSKKSPARRLGGVLGVLQRIFLPQ